MFSKQTVRDIDLKGKTVLLRADYNVPLEDGKITDDYRIKQSLPTLEYLLDQSAKVIICSHLGRPDGPNDSANSLFPVAKRLQQLLDRRVAFAPDCVGETAKKAVAGLKKGEVLLLENLRFHPEEKANDAGFTKELASLAEIFVQDGFGVVHRADASTDAITKHLPAVAGLLLEKEVRAITGVMEKPQRPLMAIVGGAKVSDKIEILERFIEIADFVAIGGALANPFLVAQDINVGDSLYDKADLPIAKKIMRLAEVEAKKRPFVFFVPHDGVVAEKIDKTASTRIVEWKSHMISDVEHYPHRVPAKASTIRAAEMILDIGPFSAAFIAGAVQQAKTVILNGAVGVTETASLHGPVGPTSHGTQTVVEALLGDFGHKPFTLVGGGDTVGYVESKQLAPYFGHVSTGGGASLELMAGHKLPGIEALRDKK